jgi:hypothetical protein
VRKRILFFLWLLLFCWPRVSAAQLDNPTWGLTVSVVPLWSTPSSVMAEVFDADAVDLHGPELRLGVVRGTTLGGEWGISLVHKRFKKDSDVELSSEHGQAIFVTEDAEMIGGEVHRFFVFGSIAQRVQLGVNLALGAARIRGIAKGRYSTAPPGSAEQQATVLTPEIFEFVGRELVWMPIGKAEFGVATRVGDRLKVRVSSGLNFPGYQIVGVTVSYLMGHDR